jgi:hypothetical protein
MNTIDEKSDGDLYKSLLAEIAKATNELRCAEGDVKKAQSRLGFTLMVLNILIDRSDSITQTKGE